MHQLHGVAGGQAGFGKARPTHDPAIVLHHDRSGIEPEMSEEIAERGGPGQVPRCAIHRNSEFSHI